MTPLIRLTLAATATLSVVVGSTAAASSPTVEASWPDAAKVEVGTPLVVTGTVAGVEPGATVVLQYDLRTGWRTASSTTAAEDGGYELAIPTGWLHGAVGHRVVVDGTTSASATWELRVKPTWDPRGRRVAWNRMLPKGVLRWDPCDTVSWRFNRKGAPKGALRVTREVVRRTARATGLQFEYLGRTRHVPSKQHPAPAGTDLAVAWVRPSATDLLSGSASGAAGVQIAHSDGTIDGRPEYLISSAGVAMNRSSRPPRPGFRGGNSLGAVLMHELGHAVGLAHVGQRSRQIMVPIATPGPRPHWGAGDLAGLEYLGLKQGCGDVPGDPRTSTRAALRSYVVVD